MTPTDTSLLSALTLGFLGSSHCLVMCGGIGAALGMGVDPGRRHQTVLLFQLGRVLTYALLGAGLGALIASVATLQSAVLPVLRVLSGVLLVAMGLSVANWWRGMLVLEKLGQGLWRHVQPHAQARLPIRSASSALGVGMLWGFLPCGLIYTALAWSATAGNWRDSATLMLFFGLGTLPAMIATGLAAERLSRLLKARGFRSVAALLLVASGLWTSWIGIQHAGHGAAAAGGEHQHHQH